MPHAIRRGAASARRSTAMCRKAKGRITGPSGEGEKKERSSRERFSSAALCLLQLYAAPGKGRSSGRPRFGIDGRGVGLAETMRAPTVSLSTTKGRLA
jgi:hypothetical protein